MADIEQSAVDTRRLDSRTLLTPSRAAISSGVTTIRRQKPVCVRTYSNCDACSGVWCSSRSTRARSPRLPVVVLLGPLGLDFDDQRFAVRIKFIGHGEWVSR